MDFRKNFQKSIFSFNAGKKKYGQHNYLKF